MKVKERIAALRKAIERGFQRDNAILGELHRRETSMEQRERLKRMDRIERIRSGPRRPKKL